ncbi:hypothetical protein JOF56_004806 [Kibdelosporangium banguiense]|uniref:DUF4145 domain-containing protein n=1 Tax=Kibdelosporangium banguiense TaxID=1365924 RepID=A0ABS4TJ23_9PSEU|nr:hypothetical protein [Kibdelosporangium banguiense]MBP2324421.1 hypothetical protein [Kibdelosporangium banguiense]
MNERLDYVRQLLGTPGELIGVWPQCCVWLLRLAVENEITALWESRRPEMNSCSMRAQFIALRQIVDTDTAHEAAALWSTLSRASHHHDYELAPTVHELYSLHATASRICAALRQGTSVI